MSKTQCYQLHPKMNTKLNQQIWIWIALTQKSILSHVLTTFPTFYETWGFVTALTTARRQSLSGVRLLPIPLKSTVILSSHLQIGLLSSLLLSGFPTKILYALLPARKCGTCTNRDAPHYALLSTILLLPRFYAQISSSASYPRKHPAYVLAVMWEIIFLTHTTRDLNISICRF